MPKPTGAERHIGYASEERGRVRASGCSPCFDDDVSQASRPNISAMSGSDARPERSLWSDRPRATSRQPRCAPGRRCRHRSCAIVANQQPDALQKQQRGVWTSASRRSACTSSGQCSRPPLTARQLSAWHCDHADRRRRTIARRRNQSSLAVETNRPSPSKPIVPSRPSSLPSPSPTAVAAVC